MINIESLENANSEISTEDIVIPVPDKTAENHDISNREGVDFEDTNKKKRKTTLTHHEIAILLDRYGEKAFTIFVNDVNYFYLIIGNN